MTIYKVQSWERSHVYWNLNLLDNENSNTTNLFRSRDGKIARELSICPDYPSSIAHELGHILDCQYLDFKRYRWVGYETYTLSVEIRAWRIAKSIMRPELWSEEIALDCLNNYYEKARQAGYPKRENWDRLTITPLNKGVKIT